MPFVTSEIYQALANYNDKDLMMTSWPKTRQRVDYDDNYDIIEKLKEMIVEIRNIRATKNIHPSKKADLLIVTEHHKQEIEEAKEFLLKLGFGKKLIIQENKKDIPEESIQIIKDGIELYMPLEGLIDQEEEHKRLEEEKIRLQQEITRCEKMLSNPGFMKKAPQAKIEEEKAKLEKYKIMLEKLKK